MEAADYIKEILSLTLQIDAETDIQATYTFFGKLSFGLDVNLSLRDKSGVILTRCSHSTPKDYQYTIDRLYSILQEHRNLVAA